MDDLAVGRVLRESRRRLGLPQSAVARRAGISQSLVSRIERGHLGPIAVDRIRMVAAVLEVRLAFAPTWRGGELARLLDSRHAGLVEAVVARLRAAGWEVVVEATFSEFGERGSIDVLAWQAASRTLLVIEVKSRIVDLQGLLGGIDRKRRLASTVARRGHGWDPASIGVVLVLPAGSTSGDAVARHRATFDATLPARTVQVKRWILDPVGPLRGILFVRESRQATRPTTSSRSEAPR